MKKTIIIMAALAALVSSATAEDSSNLSRGNLRTRIASELMLSQHIGRPNAEKQTDELMQYCDKLGNEGVISRRVFEIMVAELAITLSPKQIKEALSPMADLLVARNGTQTTDKDAQEFAAAFAQAVSGE